MKQEYSGRHWFEDSRIQIEWSFGKDYDLYCRLLAATSPLSTIVSNVKMANKAYRQLKLDGKVDYEQFIRNQAITLQKFLGDHPDVMGRKVWSLYQNLVGNEQVCAIDRWMMRHYGIELNHLTMNQYDKIEKAIIKEARQMGLSPAQRQSEIWVAERGKYESYASVLRELGVHRDNLLRRLL